MVDSFTGRFSSHPAADSQQPESLLPSDITRVTPFSRWDVDEVLPAAVSQRQGSRFGR